MRLAAVDNTPAGPVQPGEFRTCADILSDPPRDTFLIEGLVHSAATILTGLPGHGKTTLAGQIASAIALGEDEFLGRAVRGHGLVMVACTDPGEDRAWAERIAAARVGLGDVLVTNYRAGVDWGALLSDVERRQPALFIFDNVLGATEGDIRGNEYARRLLDPLNAIADRGVPVLLVHHDGRMGNAVMGSTAYEAWARTVVTVKRTGDGTLGLSVRSNDAAPSRLSIDLAFGKERAVSLCVNSDQPVEDKRARRAYTHAERRELGQRIVNDPELAAMSQRELKQRLGESQSKISRALSEVGAVKRGGVWSL